MKIIFYDLSTDMQRVGMRVIAIAQKPFEKLCCKRENAADSSACVIPTS